MMSNAQVRGVSVLLHCTANAVSAARTPAAGNAVAGMSAGLGGSQVTGPVPNVVSMVSASTTLSALGGGAGQLIGGWGRALNTTEQIVRGSLISTQKLTYRAGLPTGTVMTPCCERHETALEASVMPRSKMMAVTLPLAASTAAASTSNVLVTHSRTLAAERAAFGSNH